MWAVGLRRYGDALAPEGVRSFGTALGIRFPLDYEMFALIGMAGGQPRPNIFLINEKMGEATISHFVHPQDMAAMRANAPHLYGDDLIPVAEEGTGDKVCLSRTHPGVFYVAHELLDEPCRGRIKIAPNWTDFVALLRPLKG